MSKYLVVGAGLFGAVFANEAAKRGHEVTVIEKRDHLAGNIYTKEWDPSASIWSTYFPYFK